MDLVIAALATWQIVEIWRHSTLMAPLRARAELLTGFFGQLLSCPWCLSVWVGLCCGLLLDGPIPWLAKAGVRWILLGFACSRLANVCNDFFASTCRTPRLSLNLPPDSEET